MQIVLLVIGPKIGTSPVIKAFDYLRLIRLFRLVPLLSMVRLPEYPLNSCV